MRNKFGNKIGRISLIIAGSLSLVLGTIGIIVPILPTTPFLLLSAACYARSSQRFYNWLLNNRLFGVYIKNYREGKGVPGRIKYFTISLLWLTIILSVVYASENNYVRVLLICVAIAVSIHILTIKPKYPKKQ
jgi:uncharacterized protein